MNLVRNKRKYPVYALLLCLILAIVSTAETDQAPVSKVWVIELHTSINAGSADYLLEALNEAKLAGAEQVIIDLDTYGGLIQDAKRISDRLLEYSIPTAVYINPNAQSAGVLISISANEIYMAPNSSLGSAETVPNHEKALSMWRSWLRSAAEQRGYNQKLIEAMADKRIVIEGLVGEDELVNLNAKEALEEGLAQEIVQSREKLVAQLGYDEGRVEVISPGFIERVHQMLSWPWALALLFMIGTGMMFVEVFVPGFGVFGIISIVCYGLFFFNIYRGGDVAMAPLIALIIGMVLLVVELFIPGFGIAGIGGIILVAYGVINLLGIGWGLLAMAGILTLLIIIFYVLTKKGKKSKLFHRLGLATELNDEAGFSSREKPSIAVGTMAKTASELRPSGYIISEGTRYDALAEEGSFIGKNKDVVVIKIDGRRIIVREVNHA